MIRADIETAVSPIVGNEKQSEEMVNFLLQEFEGAPAEQVRADVEEFLARLRELGIVE